MKLSFKLLASVLLCFTGMSVYSQFDTTSIKRGCGTKVPPVEWDSWFNQKVEERKQTPEKNANSNWTIPVIVHVIHGGQSIGTFPNISQLQIYSQFTILNNDYAGQGYNANNLAVTAFSAVGAANCNISFCPAEKDQNGNMLTEPGIDRIDYTAMSWVNPNSFTSQSAFQNFMDNTVKPNTIWNPIYYYNIWVSDVSTNVGLLGYSTFPAGSGLTGLPSIGTSSDDGVWVWAKSFGSTGTVLYPYNKGRTASHETGHYLGLRHIGGDGNNNENGDCSATDYCNDTPPQLGGYAGGQYGQNFGAPTYPLYAAGTKSCSGAPNGNMFMNFMDYTDDPSCYMFTPDQSQRMAAAMTNGTYRKYLTGSFAGCNSIILGVDRISLLEQSISLFPNPSSGIVNLSVSSAGNQNLSLTIHNYLGQFITSTSYKDAGIGAHSIDMSAYPNGVYFVTVDNGQAKVVKRLILNK